jgi:signal transduction histidine kinase
MIDSRLLWQRDVPLAAALAALSALNGIVLVAPSSTFPAPSWPWIVVWAILLAAPLVFRRRYPLTVLLVMALHFPFYWAVGQIHEIASWLALGVAVYSAGAYGNRRRAVWVAAGCLALISVIGAVTAVLFSPLSPAAVVAVTITQSLPFALGWPLGVIVRRLREYRAALEEQNRQLDRQREADARRAVLEERVRIARELHDVVAHHVSLMGIQAGVARRLFDLRPEDAIEAISSVETGSRQAIADLQQLVGVLRRQDDADDLAPQPSLEQLPALVEHMQQAGLSVDLTVEGRERPLPAGVELSAYRIVQEALTNTLKHAGTTRAGVVVRYRDHGVEVEVLDDGQGRPTPNGPAGGKGLLGMRERVTVHGGRLEAGPRPDGGFRVHAVLNGGAA